MPKKINGEPVNEAKWEKAKSLAEKQGHGGEYDYIMGIYKRMAGMDKSLTRLVISLEKAGRKLPPGTVRTHGGKKVRKQPDGTWKPVKKEKKSKTQDSPKPKGPPVQPSKDLDEIYAMNEAVMEEFKEFVTEIGEQVGAKDLVFRPTLKGKARAKEKAVSDYGGDFSRLVDINGATAVFDTKEDVKNMLAALENHPQVVRVKNRLDPPPPALGYQDVLFNIEMSNGVVVELLGVQQSMFDEKMGGVGHEVYEVIRSMPRTAEADRINKALIPFSRGVYKLAGEKQRMSGDDVRAEWKKLLSVIGATMGDDLPTEVKNAKWMTDERSDTTDPRETRMEILHAAKRIWDQIEVKKSFRLVLYGDYLMKGRKPLPDGTIRVYNGLEYKKVAGQWEYLGKRAGKTVTEKKKAKVPAPKKKPDPPKDQPLKPVSKAKFDNLKKRYTSSTRFGEGQKVKYTGTYQRGRTGQEGTLVAIGHGGYAMVKFPDGTIQTAAWRDLQPIGKIESHSLYDGLSEKQVFQVAGEIRKVLDSTMKKKIGSSGMTYNDLCKEFESRGFNLHVVGGTVRDVMQGDKDINDVDFIFNGTYNELFHILKDINPSWTRNAVTNDKINLVSFTDGADTVDITSVHKFSREMNSMASGWNLKDDAESRDLVMNTLQYDPLTGTLVDVLGAVEDIEKKQVTFTNPYALKAAPRYILRAFKFLARGYAITPAAEKVLKRTLLFTKNMSPRQRGSFMKRQVGMKDGLAGLDAFKASFRKYDAKLWDQEYDYIWRNVYREFGGTP